MLIRTIKKEKLAPLLARMKALLAHGLLGAYLIRCWVGWQIQPLSVRGRLLCEYSGLDDPIRYAHTQFEPAALLSACKKYLAESKKDIAMIGIAPFRTGN